MTLSPRELDAVIDGLSKAQRNAIVRLETLFTWWPISIGRVTIKRLKDKGLIIFESPASGFGMRTHRFTPLGQQVRARLSSKEPDNG